MGKAGEGGPERRPLQLRFNEQSVQLKLIKTRLELSHVSDLHRLKPPRIHPSLFPVNNWAPVGSQGGPDVSPRLLTVNLTRGGRVGRRPTARLPVVLPPYQRGGREPTPEPAPSRGQSGKAASRSPQGTHAGRLAPSLPSFMQSTKLPQAPQNCDGRQWPGLSEFPSASQGSIGVTVSPFVVPIPTPDL